MTNVDIENKSDRLIRLENLVEGFMKSLDEISSNKADYSLAKMNEKVRELLKLHEDNLEKINLLNSRLVL